MRRGPTARAGAPPCRSAPAIAGPVPRLAAVPEVEPESYSFCGTLFSACPGRYRKYMVHGLGSRLWEISEDRARRCGRWWEIVVHITWYSSIAVRGECFPEMLPRIGVVPSRRKGRKRWSEARLFWPEIPNIRLVLLARLRPPFSAISTARDDPYTWDHLPEAFSTLRYPKTQG